MPACSWAERSSSSGRPGWEAFCGLAGPGLGPDADDPEVAAGLGAGLGCAENWSRTSESC